MPKKLKLKPKVKVASEETTFKIDVSAMEIALKSASAPVADLITSGVHQFLNHENYGKIGINMKMFLQQLSILVPITDVTEGYTKLNS